MKYSLDLLYFRPAMKIATCTVLGLILSATLIAQQKEIDSIKQVLPSQEPLDQVRSWNELSWYYKNSDLDSSIIFAKTALSIGQREQSKRAIAQSYNSLANTYSAKGLFDSALNFHQRSYVLRREIHDSSGMASSLNNQGIAYDELGNYPKALEVYFESLRLYETVSDDPYDVAMVLGNIGIVYKKQKEYPKVLEYYQKALNIYTSVDSEFGIIVTKGNIGNVLLTMGRHEEAIQYSDEARAGYEKAGYTRYVPYMINNIGVANDSLGKVEEARKLYFEAIEGHLAHENFYELANTHLALSANFRKTSDHKKAYETAQQAWSYANDINSLEFRAKSSLELSEALAGLRRFDEAYAFSRQFTQLNDSIFEENKTKQIFELQTQYETEKNQQQITLQEAQISLQEAQLEEQNAVIQRNRIASIAGIVVFLLLLLVSLLWRARTQKKQEVALQTERVKAREAEINATISSQEKERARYARDLHDGFGQMISILNMNLANLKDGASPDERQQVFDQSEQVINEMYEELKSICFDLMPQTLISQGLESAIQEYANRISSTGKIFVETNFFGLEQRPDELQEISLYRISQEWVNNILKYSDARKITLQITRDKKEITLLIEDDGQGFDKTALTKGKGNGWKNLNTRAHLIQGEIEFETQIGTRGNVLILNAPSFHSTDRLDLVAARSSHKD